MEAQFTRADTIAAFSRDFQNLAFGVKQKADAYLHLAVHNRFADYDLGSGHQPTVQVGFTIDLGNDSVKAVLLTTALSAAFAAEAASRLTTSMLNQSSGLGKVHVTAEVTFPLLLLILALPWVKEMQLCASMLPRRAVPRWRTGAVGAAAIASPPKSGQKKMVALIDHGCPFAHAQFRAASGVETKVFAIWDQDLQPDFPYLDGTTPSGFGYGRQVGNASLNRFLAATLSPSGFVEEDRCYELAEYGPMRHGYTHGALTSGMLAGNDISSSLSSCHYSQPHPTTLDADFVFVQLPRAVAAVPDRGSVERCILDGIAYALDCAGPDVQHIAVVVDYGTELGPHNGQSWFERALSAMVRTACSKHSITLDIVFPSGNSHEARLHAVVYATQPTKVTTAELGWWVPLGNDAPATLEIWAEDANANFNMTVQPPGSVTAKIAIVGQTESVSGWTHVVGGRYSVVVVNKKVGADRQILVQISPTLAGVNGQPTGVPGVWKFGFDATASPCQNLCVYAAWGGNNAGFPKRVGRTRLLSQDFNVSIQGDGSTLGSAFGDESWVVSGFKYWGSFNRAKYASGGAGRGVKTKAGNITSRHISAVTEQSPSLPGLLCIGNRSSIFVRARGTSFGPPQKARDLSHRYGKIIVGPPPQIPKPIGPPSGTPIELSAEYGEYRLFPPP